MRRGEGEGLGRQDVKEGGRRGKGLNPVGGRHGGLKQQVANDIIYRANNTFSFTVLRRSVRAGHAEMDALPLVRKNVRVMELSNSFLLWH